MFLFNYDTRAYSAALVFVLLAIVVGPPVGGDYWRRRGSYPLVGLEREVGRANYVSHRMKNTGISRSIAPRQASATLPRNVLTDGGRPRMDWN